MLFPSLVRGGAIRTEQTDDAVQVRAEVNVRLAPGLIAVLALTALPLILGARPMDSALSFLVSGGVIQFFYLKAVVGFWKYVGTLCKLISPDRA